MSATLSGFFLVLSSRITARFRLISVLHPDFSHVQFLLSSEYACPVGAQYSFAGVAGVKQWPGGECSRPCPGRPRARLRRRLSGRLTAVDHLRRKLHARQYGGPVGAQQEPRLAVVEDPGRLVPDGGQLAVDERVFGDDAVAGLLLARGGGPHLVEDKVAVGVGDELPGVYLDALDGVGVIANDQVGAVVDGQVPNHARVIGGDAVARALRR